MILIDRYGIGPYYGTAHPFNQMRQVYRYRGTTAYIDVEPPRKRCEVFCVHEGSLWYVGEFATPSAWDFTEYKAQKLLDEHIDTYH